MLENQGLKLAALDLKCIRQLNYYVLVNTVQSPQKFEQKVYFINVSEKYLLVISKGDLYANSILLANNRFISNS